MQALYATDASVYRLLPKAVALPKHSEDLKILIEFARQHKTSLIPRAAGTSLAGQCVGGGIVVDISKYMNAILEINPEEKWIKVQPGVIRDELNEFLKPYGLFFGPNTSTANRCMMGGMVGNNSCGSTSIVYGATRDHVIELKTLLSDGTEAIFNAVSVDDFKDKCELTGLEGALYRNIFESLTNETIQKNINAHFPKESVSRRNTGYAADALLNSSVFNENKEDFNFCKLLSGSEGTLAFTTEIKLNLVPLPLPFEVVVAAHFTSIEESLKAAVISMKESPSACELMDKTILDCTKDNLEQKHNRFFIEGDPEAILMLEFRAETLQAARQKARSMIELLQVLNLGYAFPKIIGSDTKKVWDLRKAGLGLLANIPGHKKAVACIEDTAVAVEDLPEYIQAFTTLMKRYNQKAVYYAHAGAGELHLRPILDLKVSEDVKLFRKISEESAKLVKEYQGSLSGEHGDGIVRSEFIPLVLGDTNYKLLQSIKQTWDKHNIFNPGKIVDALAMDENLRYDGDKKAKEIDTIFNFEDTGGLLATVEKCNGSGDCRKLSFAGGTMCPSYRATLDEKDSTRGRANVLREFLTQNTKENPFNHPEIKSAMDLCISCKGCKSECPSNVDMATLKSEFLYQYSKKHGISLRTKAIAHIDKLNTLASRFPRVHNYIIRQSWFKKGLGIATQRTLPNLYKSTFRKWFVTYKQEILKEKVFLFCDEYTNYYDVEIGIKTVKVLNALGYEVLLIHHAESGRAYISKGFLEEAKSIAEENVKIFSKIVTSKRPLIGIEPSAILGFRDEYPNLVSKDLKQAAQKLSRDVLLVEEFLANQMDLKQISSVKFTTESANLKLHGHCHQKALSSTKYTKQILNLPINYVVDEIPSGCCGMAGSFGYEKEHYELSQTIGNQVLFPALKLVPDKTIIVAGGTSCRHQIFDGVQRKALHPIEVLFDALK
ncbi:MAG: FAD-binding protein [Flavobacteriaceae bacterium]|nr:FAD-binding protein [Flavobacteriaceae bacterium]